MGTAGSMEPTPQIPSSDEADPEIQSTPGGLVEELEREAEESGAEVGPDETEDDSTE